MTLTPYHAKYYAYELTKRYSSNSLQKFTASLVDAQVDLKPHQVDAALFAFILENDKEVIKWLSPAPNQFRIYWLHNNRIYEPDFIAETEYCNYMIEVKASNEMQVPEVQAKAPAAIKYCNYATEYTAEHGGKPWKYVLIPHDKVAKNSSFIGIVSPNIVK